MRITLAICALVALCGVSRAAVTIDGSTGLFTGPGVYTFDFTVTAVGQSEEILGFTIPLQNLNGALPLAEAPNVSLSDIEFTPNPLVELRLASSDFTGSGFGFSISAQDNNGSPLFLNAGESAVLFSIPMNVIAAGDVLGENVPLAGLQTITTSNGPAIVQSVGTASLTAVPEPSSGLALAVTGIGAALLRRRRIR